MVLIASRNKDHMQDKQEAEEVSLPRVGEEGKGDNEGEAKECLKLHS